MSETLLEQLLVVLGRVVAACEDEEAPSKKWADLRLVARDTATVAKTARRDGQADG